MMIIAGGEPTHSYIIIHCKNKLVVLTTVVTLVADKLETERFTLVWKTNRIRQPKKHLPCSSYITTVQWQPSVRVITNAL